MKEMTIIALLSSLCLVDEQFYTHRYVIERTFAWMDAFKILLIRFEKTTQNWISFILLACITITIRQFK